MYNIVIYNQEIKIYGDVKKGSFPINSWPNSWWIGAGKVYPRESLTKLNESYSFRKFLSRFLNYKDNKVLCLFLLAVVN